MKKIKELFKKSKNLQDNYHEILDNEIVSEEELPIEDSGINHSFNELKQYIQKIYEEQQKRS